MSTSKRKSLLNTDTGIKNGMKKVATSSGDFIVTNQYAWFGSSQSLNISIDTIKHEQCTHNELYSDFWSLLQSDFHCVFVNESTNRIVDIFVCYDFGRTVN